MLEHEHRPGMGIVIRASRPAWRLVGRPTAGGAEFAARFGLGRLTPGQLGLELTTLLALLAVGGFSFFFLGSMVDGSSLPRIDNAAADVAASLTVDAFVDVVRVFTEVGSLPVTAALALGTAAWALTRRRWIDAATLALGVPLVFAGVHIAKDAYGRIRPEDMLTAADLASYPSGHTAYAVTWVACATVLVRAGSGWAVRFAAVTVTIVLVAAVGLSRVYLRVHYLTDVLGGAAMAAAVWAALGAIALVAGHVRHNDRG
jgi:undecaprenyl-diphosphatase